MPAWIKLIIIGSLLPIAARALVCHESFKSRVFDKDTEFLQVYHANLKHLGYQGLEGSVIQTTKPGGGVPELSYLIEGGAEGKEVSRIRQKIEDDLGAAFSTNKKFTQDFVKHLDHLNEDLPKNRISHSLVRRNEKILGHLRLFDGSIHDPNFPERTVLYGTGSELVQSLQHLYFTALQISLEKRTKFVGYDFLMPFERALIERGVKAEELANSVS